MMDFIGRLMCTVVVLAWFFGICAVLYQGIGHMWGFAEATPTLGILTYCVLFVPCALGSVVTCMTIWLNRK